MTNSHVQQVQCTPFHGRIKANVLHGSLAMPIYAWSDLHTDYTENLALIASIPPSRYQHDSIILAGDISDKSTIIKKTLTLFTERFSQVFFIPGNHDLWLYKKDHKHSLDKLLSLQQLCAELGVITEPTKIIGYDMPPVWVVPLYSWYDSEQQSEDSLYVSKTGEDPLLRMWMDNYRIQWPKLGDSKQANQALLALNITALEQSYDAPIISFSHFLSHRAQMFPGKVPKSITEPYPLDPYPEFNFSRVAGSSQLHQQIKKIGARIHIYGHQHRNRQLVIDKISFISHCLGHKDDPIWRGGLARHLPRKIWPVNQHSSHNTTD